MHTNRRRLLTGLALFPFAVAPLLGAGNGPAEPLVVTEMNDVMDGKTPAPPAFPKLAPKPGRLRGYVKDAAGRPLEGAKILVTTSAVGGLGSGVTAESDAKGYYEAPLPVGISQVWCAGYGVTYHGVRLALALRPADGKLGHFEAKKGAVENFYLAPYGIANEASVSENPVYAGGYYGASFTVGYWVADPDRPGITGGVPEGSTIEITLTPQGPLVDGSKGRTLVLRKKLEPYKSYFQVNDVPVGRYTIAARLITDGGSEPLRLKDNSGRPGKGGMTPKETEDSATIIFRSEGADHGILRVTGGSMERLSMLVERIEKK